MESLCSLDREAAGQLLAEAADHLVCQDRKRQRYLSGRLAGGCCSCAPTTPPAPRWPRDYCGTLQATGSEEERLEVFRGARDEIRARIEKELVPAGRNLLTS
jgi:hypothetical protein